ncbi:NADPH-dependent FMN reductase [Bacillus sp. B15-48]|uniref:NADPH-dependent FMN reductase n=1 Tax=Bacillus sp. B15-48 TaxID=1548601 RepID=UPI00193EFE99|nr:NADPH-dependent FMN reductase [Bacillus sp. B15-48]MBM4763725.1 NADH-dependent FMN reductase [Bacillus sp. B15-48]
MKLLGISGTIIGAKPSILVRKILYEVSLKYPEVEVEMLDLRDYDLQFCDGRSLEEYNEDTRKAISTVMDADFFLFGTPVFNCSIPAPLKNLIDLIPPETFRNKVMGFAASGGTYQHYLMIENQLKPIMSYFRAYLAPSYVYAHSDHYNHNNEIVDEEIIERIQNLADELVHLQKSLHAVVVY